MAATTHSADPVLARAAPPLGDTLEVSEIRPGRSVTIRGRSLTHLLDAAVTAAIRAEEYQ